MAKGKTKIQSFPTPIIDDVLFYEIIDISRDKYELDYGVPHYDQEKWPEYEVVSWSPLPQQGESVYAVFYAAPRRDQDEYNWEHSKADLSGFKFDTVTRSYIVKRADYKSNTPELGSTMPDVPIGKFAASRYILISRNQDRISERGRRAQESIGGAELDSLYVVELRTYIDRAELVEQKYDDQMNGVLYRRANIWIRGEEYASGVKIEQAVEDEDYWLPTTDGQISSFDQVSDDVWVVITEDIIPQSSTTNENKFGGKVIRRYDTSITYTWPAVLGDDGTETGEFGIELMDWVDKGGTARTYPRVKFKRQEYRGPCSATIHLEWLTQDQLEAANTDVIQTFKALPIAYSSPYLNIRIGPTLHDAITLKCDTGSSDPTWGENVGSARTFPATTLSGSADPVVDWPASLIVDVDIAPYRGGYLVTHVTARRPYE